MPTPQELFQQRQQRDAALTTALTSEARIRAIDTAIASAQRSGRTAQVGDLQAERALVVKTAADSRALASELRQDALSNLGQWLQQTQEQIVGTCSAAHPFVLLPIRLETKFSRSSNGAAEFRVRIFPDEISVAVPPSAVSESEINAGQTYWRARRASQLAPADSDLANAYSGAWTAMASRFGAYRAGFIVSATAPTNPSAAPSELVFEPSPAPTEPPLPRAEALPDRFVILTYAADPTTGAPQEINRVTGLPIPDDLVLAPDTIQSDSSLSRDPSTGRINVPDTLRWMVDFDAAVAVGMAVRIPLAPPFDTNGFARVIALGIRSATPPEQGSAALENLFSKHRYGSGLALLRAGTPTNNTDSAMSGWQPPSSDAQQLFTIEDNPPDLTPPAGGLGTTDGARLADLFGLSSEFVRRLPNAAATDIAEALTMNRAAAAGTLDNFVGDFFKDLISVSTADALHSFFVNWVSGRSHFPALRVGRQPYGIVLTSAWKSWEFPAPIPVFRPIIVGRDISPILYRLIDQHRPRWRMLADRVSKAGDTSSDPFQQLLSMIGLLASSTDFVSRRAVSDEYLRQRLRFGGATDIATEQWFNTVRAQRNQNLTATNFPAVVGPIDPLIAFMVFTGTTDEWKLPIVDRDPAVPLSEHVSLGSYDGTHNYLQWLTQASRDDLLVERFLGADGSPVGPPTALLYVLLRHSLLAALETGTIGTAQQFGSAVFDVIDRDPVIANIAEQQHVLRKDYLEVDASRIGLSPTPIALADWTLATARAAGSVKPGAVQNLADTHDAIEALADLPTARLERLLAEHIDLCSYRIDAWITALYAQRLAQKRAEENPRGLFLGAFGWLENVRPAGPERQRISVDILPEALRDNAGPNLFVEAANGGYVHAPSLAQASSAAVLRNGYLSHASSDQPLPFAVNLSSTRMRQALALIQGVRGGQPIAALLGYQFERGLHENHPGVELDSFIYLLRDRFPLVSGRLTDLPEGTSAETVEARNVVDGLSLVEFTQDKIYPYSLDNLPDAGSTEGVAIAAEVAGVRDALDAVSDLLLAESVHQAVQGNFARTKASLQALTAPEAPPEPEIIRTPRSGRVLTFRVALALDANASSGWNSTLSPRALANAALNHWLTERLPAAAKIQWNVADGDSPAQQQSFATWGLEPIDLVLMSGDRLGDGSSELERYIIRRYRADHAVPDERVTVVAPMSGPIDSAASTLFNFNAAAVGATALTGIHPLLVRLRRLIAKARATHAGDWRRGADVAQADPTDPTGSATEDPKLIGFKDLTDRLDATSSALALANDTLKAKLAALAPLLASLSNDASTIDDPAWPVGLEDLRQALFQVVPFGFPEALPADGLAVTTVVVGRLANQAQTVGKLVEQRLAAASVLRATTFPSALPSDEPARTNELARRNDVLRRNYLDTARALLGAAFTIVPLHRFQSDQSAEIQQALAAPVAAPASVTDSWIHSVSRVRPTISDLTWASAVSRWIGQSMGDPTVLQLPHRPGTPWIGGKFGADLPSAEWLSLIALNTPVLANPLQAGLLLDDWTETVPTDKETTGVSFNFNRPNATAPQAVLVAVPPVLTGNWSWEDLIASVHEALDLAHLRAVEPDALLGRNAGDLDPAGNYFQTLPAMLSEFSQMRVATIDYAARVKASVAQT